MSNYELLVSIVAVSRWETERSFMRFHKKTPTV